MAHNEALHALAQTFTRAELPGSEIEFKGEVPPDILSPYRTQAVLALRAGLELPGFRKGHVPEEIMRKKLGDMAILEETVEFFFRDFYPELVHAAGLAPVGRPTLAITKLAPDTPVGLTIKTAVYPEVQLPDYQKIARKIPRTVVSPVTEEELAKAIDTIRKSRAGRSADGTELPSPELTDAFVKELGPFEGIADFKEKLKAELAKEKERAEKEKRRAAIIEAILEKTTVDIPEVFVEGELDKALGQMKEDVKRFSLSFDEYLKKINKTEAQMREDFRDGARKRAKLQLTLNAIAEQEGVAVPAEDIKKEAEHLLAHWKEADRERVHIYVESVMRNEKTLAMLEGLS